MGLLNRKNTGRVQKIEKDFEVVNPLGVHARPAAKFVRITSGYRSEIWVGKEGEEVNGKSVMGLMMLAAGQGSVLHIRCQGSDADQLLQELETLIDPMNDQRTFSDVTNRSKH